MINPLTIAISRAINFFVLHFSYFISILIKKSLVWGQPFAITFEPTNICNLHCPECPVGNGSLTRSKGLANVHDFSKLVEHLKFHAFYLNLYFQGEPSLHPQLGQLVKLASQNKFHTVISTNAQVDFNSVFSGDELKYLSKLIISLDGFDQKTYAEYRKDGSFDKVLQNINKINQWKIANKAKLPKIELQVLVNKFNENNLEDLQAIAKKYRAVLKLKSMQIISKDSFEHFLPVLAKYSRYTKIRSGKYTIKNAISNRCYRLWSTAVITWNGAVVPCCFDKDADFSMGNAFESEFSQIWKSTKYQQFRQNILVNRKSIEICRNCTEGLAV